MPKFGEKRVDLAALREQSRVDIAAMRADMKGKGNDPTFVRAQEAADETTVEWGIALNEINNQIADGELKADEGFMALGLQLGGMIGNAMYAAASIGEIDALIAGIHRGETLVFTHGQETPGENYGTTETVVPFEKDVLDV